MARHNVASGNNSIRSLFLGMTTSLHARNMQGDREAAGGTLLLHKPYVPADDAAFGGSVALSFQRLCVHCSESRCVHSFDIQRYASEI